MSEGRRQEIIDLLKQSQKPITGTAFAKRLQVSRQIIVQDMALLRAQGHDILATPSGYVLPKGEEKSTGQRAIICRHDGYDAMEEELKIMVDAGMKVIDVIVEHPIYGKIQRPLGIQSRIDVEDFMEGVKKGKAEPLSSLTGGEHIHHLEIPNERAYEQMITILRQKGYLVREGE